MLGGTQKKIEDILEGSSMEDMVELPRKYLVNGEWVKLPKCDDCVVGLSVGDGDWQKYDKLIHEASKSLLNGPEDEIFNYCPICGIKIERK